jgi:hypothetical protein
MATSTIAKTCVEALAGKPRENVTTDAAIEAMSETEAGKNMPPCLDGLVRICEETSTFT